MSTKGVKNKCANCDKILGSVPIVNNIPDGSSYSNNVTVDTKNDKENV